ncbi:MAG: DUF4351 domain-containing protein [Phormidesmis sp. CAN_BIN44]|nr:DUF4351 domain-containing protein [Phormidesmis sp. CAN_BIN44]
MRDLGLLGRMVQTPCLLEPYRNTPTRTEVRVSVMKLVWIQEDERRKVQQDVLSETDLPRLWILAATTSKPLIDNAGGVLKSDWMPGVYFMADIFKMAFTPSGNCEATVAIDQLPETEETLWLRILGRDETQERAIREVLALPTNHPRRNGILRLLASWKVRIDVGGIEDFSGQEALMALSEAFLEWGQATQQRAEVKGIEQGQRSLLLRQLARRVGEVPEAARSQIDALSLIQLESLGEALLDFSNLTDLEAWLAEQE